MTVHLITAYDESSFAPQGPQGKVITVFFQKQLFPLTKSNKAVFYLVKFYILSYVQGICCAENPLPTLVSQSKMTGFLKMACKSVMLYYDYWIQSFVNFSFS